MRASAWCVAWFGVACSVGPASSLDPQPSSTVVVSNDGGPSNDGGACSFSFLTYPPIGDFWCAEEARRVASATGCSSDADCELVPYTQNCIGFGSPCGRKAVLKSELEAYAQDLESRVTTFCAMCRCSLSGSCLPVTWTARCVSARCEAVGE